MKTAKELKEQELKDRLKKMYPTEEDMLLGLMTMFGTSATFTRYLSQFIDIFKHSLPESVHYAIAITNVNLTAFLHPDPHTDFELIRYPLLENLDEQTEEILHRRIKHIIKALHEHLNGEEL